MTHFDDPRRRRLLFRSQHRGTKEMDLILGRFAERTLGKMDDGQLEKYEALLEMSDPDIYNWIVGNEAPPDAHDHDVLKLIKNFNLPL